MAGENSKVILGLPNLPSDGIKPQELYPEFLTIYRAIQNLLSGVSRWTGIDGPEPDEVAVMTGTEFLLETNVTAWYPTADVNINRGQLVRITTANHCALAIANNMANIAVGIAEETKLAGQKIKIITGGCVDSITGLSASTLYYLSPTVAGAIQNLPPIAVGQVVQGIGFALDANHLLAHPSVQPRQL